MNAKTDAHTKTHKQQMDKPIQPNRQIGRQTRRANSNLIVMLAFEDENIVRVYMDTKEGLKNV